MIRRRPSHPWTFSKSAASPHPRSPGGHSRGAAPHPLTPHLPRPWASHQVRRRPLLSTDLRLIHAVRPPDRGRSPSNQSLRLIEDYIRAAARSSAPPPCRPIRLRLRARAPRRPIPIETLQAATRTCPKLCKLPYWAVFSLIRFSPYWTYADRTEFFYIRNSPTECWFFYVPPNPNHHVRSPFYW
jgi:hypothetical protein